MTISAQDLTAAPSHNATGAPDYSRLGPVDYQLAKMGVRPKLACYLATAIAVFLGWAWISFQTAGLSYYSNVPLGPGMSALDTLLQPIAQLAKNSVVLDAVLRLCSPQAVSGASVGAFAVILSMWLAMSVAMMLPSAAPMLRTYGDIAHVARGKGEHTVPLVVLAFGYMLAWTVFAIAASALQISLIATGIMSDPSVPLTGVVGGTTLILAGLYQFSSIKDACLEKCRNPFNTLFAKWTTEPSGVFKLGVEQGLFCVGCCWALMLVMLVVGTMNLAWMAFFTLFAIAEKSGKGKVTSRVTGGILFLWGGILLILSIGSY